MGRYHFIAIGGIGMSGLAKYLLEDGHTVSGSDIFDSKYITKLRELGANVSIGHSEHNIQPNYTIIKSTAIRDTNPEVVKAKDLGLEIYHRSDLLAEIAESAQEEGKCFIGFSGTHGKTTTSGMASFVLEKASLNPSFVDGGIVPELNTNAQHKSGKHFIAELDESDGTLVKYSPDILVINNLEEDHMDFYKNGMEDLVKTFNIAVSQAKKVIVNNDDSGIKLLTGDFITYGIKTESDYMAKNIIYSKEGTKFEIFHKGVKVTELSIQLAGEHNVYNTLAVVAALMESNINIKEIASYFYGFTGMGRRFQKVTEFNHIEVFDDYAHHPTEIKATLEAAALKYGKENLVAVFQPHRYTRLQALWNEFLQAFDGAGRVIVTDVYSASEDCIEGITGEAFAKELSNSIHIAGDIKIVAEKMLPILKSGDIVIGLGAGTITNLGKELEKVGIVCT